jgi:ABC-2 type transport system ATP-binding protein
MGKTIFFSTHILADVAEVCTQVGIVEAGRLVTQGSLADMQRRLRPHRTLQIVLLDREIEALQSALFGREAVLSVQVVDDPGERATLTAEFSGDDAAVSQLLRDLINAGLPVLRFSETVHDVEDVFMQVTKGIVS